MQFERDLDLGTAPFYLLHTTVSSFSNHRGKLMTMGLGREEGTICRTLSLFFPISHAESSPEVQSPRISASGDLVGLSHAREAQLGSIFQCFPLQGLEPHTQEEISG